MRKKLKELRPLLRRRSVRLFSQIAVIVLMLAIPVFVFVDQQSTQSRQFADQQRVAAACGVNACYNCSKYITGQSCSPDTGSGTNGVPYCIEQIIHKLIVIMGFLLLKYTRVEEENMSSIPRLILGHKLVQIIAIQPIHALLLQVALVVAQGLPAQRGHAAVMVPLEAQVRAEVQDHHLEGVMVLVVPVLVKHAIQRTILIVLSHKVVALV